MSIAQQVQRVDWIETAGELGALLKEARLIKQLMPLHNKRERRHAELFSLAWKGPLNAARPVQVAPVDPADTDRLESLAGIYRTRRAAREALRALADDRGLCPSVLGLERGSPCFSHQLGKCGGACCGKEGLTAHNLRLHGALGALRLPKWPWRGAIGLREGTEDSADLHVFDRWCHLGTARTEPEVYEILDDPGGVAFDYDVYRLLRRTLEHRRRSLRLMELGPARTRRRQAELLTES
jgi:DNA polymerase-3 subunit epsilon